MINKNKENRNLSKIVFDDFKNKIDEKRKLLDSAYDCLNESDFEQCATRLEMIGASFTELEWKLFYHLTTEYNDEQK